MLEKLIERKLRESVKELGGIAIKFFSPWFTGMPDRMVLMPGARIWFVEMKAPGKKAKPRQDFVMKFLERLGFEVLVIDTDEKVNEFLNRIKN